MYVKECSAYVLLQEFYWFRHTFRSLIHFDFVVVYSVKEISSFILLHVAAQFSQHCLLKGLSFLHCIFLPPCHRLIDHKCVHLFLGSLFCSIGLCVFLCPYDTVLMTVALQCSLTLRSMIPLVLFIFLKIVLAIQGPLCFHTNFKNVFSSWYERIS